MAKIVKKISVEPREDLKDNSSKGNTIKKTTINDQSAPNDDKMDESSDTSENLIDDNFKLTDSEKDTIPYNEHNQFSSELGNTTERAVELLAQTFGMNFFENIRKNKVFNLPLQDSEIPLNQWLIELLNTYISFESINEIIQSIERLHVNQESLQTKLEDLSKELENSEKTYSDKISELMNELNETKSQKTKQDKKITTSIPINMLTQAIPDNDGYGTIKSLIEEASEEPSPETGKFIIRYINGFIGLIKKASMPCDTEQEKVELYHAELSNILRNVSGLYISQRRALLDELAKMVNSFLVDFIFISPEETLQIDPLIHNAKGVGGSRIKEGVSFAVLEKSTRKTIKYADIKV